MATLNAYLTKYGSLHGADLHKAKPDDLASGLFFSDGVWADEDPDYLLVGTAEITVSLKPREDVVKNQIAVLRKQQSDIRAMAEKESTRIEQQINSLLAIEGAANEVQA